MAKSAGDSTNVDQQYGFDRVHEKLAAEDADRSAWLDKAIRAASCRYCKKLLSDSAIKKHPGRCFLHRSLPLPKE